MARLVYEHALNYDMSRFKSIRGRFTSILYPGETIIMKIWKSGKNEVVFEAGVKERPKKPIFIGEAFFHDKDGVKPKL